MYKFYVHYCHLAMDALFLHQMHNCSPLVGHSPLGGQSAGSLPSDLPGSISLGPLQLLRQLEQPLWWWGRFPRGQEGRSTRACWTPNETHPVSLGLYIRSLKEGEESRWAGYKIWSELEPLYWLHLHINKPILSHPLKIKVDLDEWQLVQDVKCSSG